MFFSSFSAINKAECTGILRCCCSLCEMLMSACVKVLSFRLIVFVFAGFLCGIFCSVSLLCSRAPVLLPSHQPSLVLWCSPTHYHHLCFSISLHLHLIISLVWFVFKSSLRRVSPDLVVVFACPPVSPLSRVRRHPLVFSACSLLHVGSLRLL